MGDPLNNTTRQVRLWIVGLTTVACTLILSVLAYNIHDKYIAATFLAKGYQQVQECGSWTWRPK